ncbi:MAG: thioredoxin TrxC [Devosia indica]|uniref:thioredoxin TrxC n=1 Tax=Devosia TaxID=46913 RepID=UPI000CE96DF5|nr:MULTISPECIES: thioredoxin TrxC [Devosia]AVF05606.1 thiol reductase thioredoxin [Devosia sp. I507]
MQHIVCAQCGATNRLPDGRDALAGKCGSCGQPLFGDGPAEVTGQNLDRQIKRSSLPILVDVWAPWCGPCRIMGPQFEAAAKQAQPEMRFLKLNSDQNQEFSSRIGIRGIPTMILFDKGREVGRVSGAMSSTDILAWARAQIRA